MPKVITIITKMFLLHCRSKLYTSISLHFEPIFNQVDLLHAKSKHKK